jgi:hypothetical protein
MAQFLREYKIFTLPASGAAFSLKAHQFWLPHLSAREGNPLRDSFPASIFTL